MSSCTGVAVYSVEVQSCRLPSVKLSQLDETPWRKLGESSSAGSLVAEAAAGV